MLKANKNQMKMKTEIIVGKRQKKLQIKNEKWTKLILKRKRTIEKHEINSTEIRMQYWQKAVCNKKANRQADGRTDGMAGAIYSAIECNETNWKIWFSIESTQ